MQEISRNFNKPSNISLNTLLSQILHSIKKVQLKSSWVWSQKELKIEMGTCSGTFVPEESGNWRAPGKLDTHMQRGTRQTWFWQQGHRQSSLTPGCLCDLWDTPGDAGPSMHRLLLLRGVRKYSFHSCPEPTRTVPLRGLGASQTQRPLINGDEQEPSWHVLSPWITASHPAQEFSLAAR